MVVGSNSIVGRVAESGEALLANDTDNEPLYQPNPLLLDTRSQVAIPLGLCTTFQLVRGLQPSDIWLAIVIGHFTRAILSVLRFRQQKWRGITVDIEPARP